MLAVDDLYNQTRRADDSIRVTRSLGWPRLTTMRQDPSMPGIEAGTAPEVGGGAVPSRDW
jgi:hypothetical protein